MSSKTTIACVRCGSPLCDYSEGQGADSARSPAAGSSVCRICGTRFVPTVALFPSHEAERETELPEHLRENFSRVAQTAKEGAPAPTEGTPVNSVGPAPARQEVGCADSALKSVPDSGPTRALATEDSGLSGFRSIAYSRHSWSDRLIWSALVEGEDGGSSTPGATGEPSGPQRSPVPANPIAAELARKRQKLRASSPPRGRGVNETPRPGEVYGGSGRERFESFLEDYPLSDLAGSGTPLPLTATPSVPPLVAGVDPAGSVRPRAAPSGTTTNLLVLLGAAVLVALAGGFILGRTTGGGTAASQPVMAPQGAETAPRQGELQPPQSVEGVPSAGPVPEGSAAEEEADPGDPSASPSSSAEPVESAALASAVPDAAGVTVPPGWLGFNPSRGSSSSGAGIQPFDPGRARLALDEAAQRARSCRKDGDPSGIAQVMVTFAPSGRVTSAMVSGPPFAGTATGGCIASNLRSARVPAFAGEFVSVKKTVVIP